MSKWPNFVNVLDLDQPQVHFIYTAGNIYVQKQNIFQSKIETKIRQSTPV